jgi:hypothetical protein
MVPALAHQRIGRAAVGVYIEDVHEDADLQRIAIEVGIACSADHHDATVGRCDNDPGSSRNHASRISKELNDEHQQQPERMDHQHSNHVASSAKPAAMRTCGQPSLAMIGCVSRDVIRALVLRTIYQAILL